MGAETPSGWLGDPLLTIKDVADFLQVCPRTVRRMIDKGELKAIPVGRLVRIRLEALKAYIQSK